MADTIGIELDIDTLNLTRGRDFKWLFTNQDDNKQPIDFPAGDLYFELDTGGQHNALQQVDVTAASGGSYKFIHQSETTSAIDYYDVTVAPHGMNGDIQSALEALPNIGSGNVLVHPASLYPVWELTLTLNSGTNEIQLIEFTGNPTGGNFKLGLGTEATVVIPFGAAASVVTTALEALTGIGSGNVSVTASQTGGYRVEFVGTKANTNMGQLVGYAAGIDLTQPLWFFGLTGGVFPSIKTSTLVQGTAKLNEQLVNTINKTVNDFFNSFDALLGVDIDFVVNSEINATLKITSLKAFVESDIITFALDVTDQSIEGLLNNVASLFGVFQTIHVDFYWNHSYRIEFVGDLAETEQDALGVDTSTLTGINNEQKVDVSVVKPGKARYTKWPFAIAGTTANLKVESESADLIQARTHWQLVFLPEGEATGGDPVARGRVFVQE